MNITSRQGSWAGPQQKFKYGANIRKNAVYTASMWIKSLGSGDRLDTFELTVKIDYRLGCIKFVLHDGVSIRRFLLKFYNLTEERRRTSG